MPVEKFWKFIPPGPRLVTDLKQNIVQSRYAAARLANKEQLLLYFRMGKILSEEIAAEKWALRY